MKKVLCIGSVTTDVIVKPVNQMIWFMSITAGITLVVCVITGYLLSRFICTPLEHLTEIIKNTADLNFSHNAKSDGLCKRTDETGFMARELRAMRRNQAQHQAEKVGAELRKLYSWNNEEDKLINN